MTRPMKERHRGNSLKFSTCSSETLW